MDYTKIKYNIAIGGEASHMNVSDKQTAVPEFKYMVSGDSISKGVVYDEARSKYVILEENYVSLLQGNLKGALRNTARFGNTLLKGFGNLKRDVLKEKPDVVLIEYGGNDCDFHWEEIMNNPEAEHNPKTDFTAFEKMLLDMIDFLKSQDYAYSDESPSAGCGQLFQMGQRKQPGVGSEYSEMARQHH